MLLQQGRGRVHHLGLDSWEGGVEAEVPELAEAVEAVLVQQTLLQLGPGAGVGREVSLGGGPVVTQGQQGGQLLQAGMLLLLLLLLLLQLEGSSSLLLLLLFQVLFQL